MPELLDPRTIAYVPELNARRTQHAKAHIKALAVDFVNPDIGQLEDIEVRKTASDSPNAGKFDYELVFGNGRLQAAMAVVKGDGVKRDTDFKISAVVAERDDAAAYTMSVIENKRRAQTTPVDDAYAANRLKELGKTDTEIGAILGVSQPWIGILRTIPACIAPIQKLVGDGYILPREAADISKLSKEQQKAVAEDVGAEVEKSGGRMGVLDLPDAEVTAEAGDDKTGKGKTKKVKKAPAKKHRTKKVAAKVRQAVKKQKGTSAKASDGPTPPSRSEMVRFWKDLADTEKKESIVNFSKTMVRYLNGSAGETAVLNAFTKAVGK